MARGKDKTATFVAAGEWLFTGHIQRVSINEITRNRMFIWFRGGANFVSDDVLQMSPLLSLERVCVLHILRGVMDCFASSDSRPGRLGRVRRSARAVLPEIVGGFGVRCSGAAF